MSRPSPIPKTAPTAGTPTHDPVAPWCAQIVALFGGPLEAVRFPDIDATALAAATEAVRQAQLEVEALERALDEARGQTQAANGLCAELCTRALAYARVFATDKPELAAEIATVSVPAASNRASAVADQAPRRRGRPRKDSITVALLPDDAASAAQ